jgi:DNA-binding transcriptional LysR family regulator
MELRHLRYFLAVAAEANVTRAAEKLGIGQPPLSQQIKALEEDVGVKLFRRTAHGMVLTAAGEVFRVEAGRVLEDAQRAIRAAQRAGRGETGQLRVGFTGSAAFNPLVPDMIRRFRQAFPGAEVTLVEANSGQLMQALEQDQLDVVFVRPNPVNLGLVRLHHLPDEPMKIAIPITHPFARKKRAPLTVFAGEPFLLVPRAAGVSLYDEIIKACREAGFDPVLGQPAPQISSVINLVAAGLGVSVVPAAIAQIRIHGVRYVDIDGPAPKARLSVASRIEDTSIVVENFLALVA